MPARNRPGGNLPRYFMAHTTARFKARVKREIKAWDKIAREYTDFGTNREDDALSAAVNHAHMVVMRLRWLLDYEASFSYADRDRWLTTELPILTILTEAEMYYGASPEGLVALRSEEEGETEEETMHRIAQRLIRARGTRHARRQALERRWSVYNLPLPAESEPDDDLAESDLAESDLTNDDLAINTLDGTPGSEDDTDYTYEVSPAAIPASL
jgi:hypothetical protein